MIVLFPRVTHELDAAASLESFGSLYCPPGENHKVGEALFIGNGNQSLWALPHKYIVYLKVLAKKEQGTHNEVKIVSSIEGVGDNGYLYAEE